MEVRQLLIHQCLYSICIYSPANSRNSKNGLLYSETITLLNCVSIKFILKGSSQHQVGGEWFEIELGKISRMLVKYEVLPIPNVISVC